MLLQVEEQRDSEFISVWIRSVDFSEFAVAFLPKVDVLKLVSALLTAADNRPLFEKLKEAKELLLEASNDHGT